jgi:hypothetical protein
MAGPTPLTARECLNLLFPWADPAAPGYSIMLARAGVCWICCSGVRQHFRLCPVLRFRTTASHVRTDCEMSHNHERADDETREEISRLLFHTYPALRELSDGDLVSTALPGDWTISKRVREAELCTSVSRECGVAPDLAWAFLENRTREAWRA